MEDPAESTKRLEAHVKRISGVMVTEGPVPSEAVAQANNMASPDTGYIGSMVGAEDGFPAGKNTPGSGEGDSADEAGQIRRRVLEAPLGSKIGYHELDDEKEDANEEWMTGEASQLSGAGTRGSSNWVLKVMVPILLIVGIIIMHNWWTDIKKHASNAVNAVGDVFDRRALMEEVEGRGVAREQEAVSPSGVEGRQEGLQDKAVYSVRLEDAPANAGVKQP